MSHGQPFSPEGVVNARVRWAGHKDPRLGWSVQDHEIIFDVADGAFEFDGDPMLLVGEARPIGRVLARARAGKHGIAQFLSSDAMFTRFDRGLVWVMDRKAKSRSAMPQRIQIGFGKQVNGNDQVQAGPDGRRPWVDPFIEFVPITGVVRKNITVMMPDERKLQNPYGIVLRGSSFGIDGDLRDNFFFPEDHHHVTDHRGPATGLAKPNDRRSTRWYDINQAGAPSVDVLDANGRLLNRGYNQNSDRIIVVHRDAGGCAGGDPEDMNLAFNFSGRTGFAYGLAEFRAKPPVPLPPEPPKDPRKTGATKPGEDNEDTYATARASAVLATMAYERGGPLSPGHPRADKHKYATNKDGIPYNPVHIHINAKFTNETVVFDGRRNVIPAFEPPIATGLIPIRCYEMFNPKLGDPFFCKNVIGGWDFHTRVQSIPVWPPTDTPPPTDSPPPTVPPPITPTPGVVPPVQPPGTPITPSPTTPEPDPNLPPTSPVTPTPPGIVRDDGEPDDDGRSPITPTPPGATPPSDWGPAETTRPSHELQPRPGNTEAPGFGRGNRPDSTARTGPQPRDTESPVEAALREQQQRERVGMSAMDLTTIGITGVPFSDHMKSPKTLHLLSFYKHKHDAPLTNHKRALRRNPPDYSIDPIYIEGQTMSEPKEIRFGSAPGLAMWASIERNSWDMRHDADLTGIDVIAPQTLGYYPGTKIAFGFAGTFWDRIAEGFEIFQGDNPFVLPGDDINQGLVIDGVNAAGEHDGNKTLDVRIPALNSNILAPEVAWDSDVTSTGNFVAGTVNLVDTSSGTPFTGTLPDATGRPPGTRVTIIDAAGSAGLAPITIDGSGAQTINGELTLVLSGDRHAVTLESNGAEWFVVAGAGNGDVVGPPNATGTAIARFAGATGKLIQNSVVLVDDGGNLDTPGHLKSAGDAVGIGYATGAGGTVTQVGSKGSTVTINKITGEITMAAGALAAGNEVTFLVNNTSMAATDSVIVNVKGGGTGKSYITTAHSFSAGAFFVLLGNMSVGSLSEAVVIRFTIIKAVSA